MVCVILLGEAKVYLKYFYCVSVRFRMLDMLKWKHGNYVWT